MENKIFIKSDNSIIDKYNREIEALIDEIKATPNTKFDIKGTRYYVSSSDGDDNNNGLSPDSPFKTITKVMETAPGNGDGIFFKRGDVFHQEGSFRTTSGVTVSAYGEGAKPVINFARDASKKSDWEETEYEHIYKYTGKLGGFENNVGTIIFDEGRAWGILVMKIEGIVDNQDKQYAGLRVDNGPVFNGLEHYKIAPKTPFKDYWDLHGNLEFYHKIDSNDNTVDELYLRCNEGNPAEVFNKIEFGTRLGKISLWGETELTFEHMDGKVYKGIRDITIDNIDIYAACFGIGMGHAKNITVQHCIFRWIGGQIQGMPPFFNANSPVRYGNAIESFGHSENFTMYHNYATQVYDCCWTVQFTGKSSMKNIVIERNVAEYANTGSELWLADGGFLSGLSVKGNYDRYIGYGFSHQRPGKGKTDKVAAGWRGAGGFFYGANNRGMNCENNDVSNNVYMLAGGSAISLVANHPDKYNFHDNVYIMEESKRTCSYENSEFCGDYTEEVILNGTQKTGAEKGTKFYCVKDNPLGDMYKLCLPK